MFRRCGLSFLHLGIEDSALAFFHSRQCGKFLFSVQNIRQHFTLHSFPAFVQNLFALGSKFLTGAFGGKHRFQITIRFADRHQRPGNDEFQDIPLSCGQGIQIGLQHTSGRQDSMVVCDLILIDCAPRPRNSGIRCICGNADKFFQLIRKSCQHFLIVIGDIAAISSRISGKFLLIKALHIIQRLLCAVPQQTVCVTLERCQVVEQGRVFGLFLAGHFLNRGNHLLPALRKQIFSRIFFRNAAAGCRTSAGQFQFYGVELLRHKGGDCSLPNHCHSQNRGHNTAYRQRLTVQARKKPGSVDADHPIGTFPAECSLIQGIVFS